MKHLLRIALILALSTVARAQPPGVDTLGWAGEDVAAAARKGMWDAPNELHLIGDARADLAGKSVSLWHAMKRMEVRDQSGAVIKKRGEHFPNVAQQVGDCVSWGNSNAVNYSLATYLLLGNHGSFRASFPPYVYGISRVQVGGGGMRGDGSCGIWAAKGLEKYGVLPADENSVPAYSGSLARKWGARPGPPEEFQALAKQQLCETRLIVDWDAACQSIANGWPIAVCSNAGFTKILEANGRIEGRWTGSWAHCMCFIAFDNREGREALYCLNSWGPNAHAKASRYAELDGAPPGGFWVLKKDAEKMLRARDSYAISFSGFKPKKSVYEQLQNPGAN